MLFNLFNKVVDLFAVVIAEQFQGYVLLIYSTNMWHPFVGRVSHISSSPLIAVKRFNELFIKSLKCLSKTSDCDYAHKMWFNKHKNTWK